MQQDQKNATAHFIDNPSIKGREDAYTTITVDLDKIIESWKISLFSFEWLTPEGKIRRPDQLPEKEQEKYDAVCQALEISEPLPRPILGIGVMENVEIGSRRDVLLTLKSKGQSHMDVHVPKTLAEEFERYL